MLPGTAYYIQIDPTVFDDTSGNSYEGFYLNDKTTLNFTTAAPTSSGEPTLTSSEISNDGSKLILTFSENISLAAGATFSALQVTVDGSTNNPVTAVNTANAELQATLSDKILDGQQITLDYSYSTQTVQDSDGNYLSSVTSQSVTNNSNVIGYINGATYEGDFHVMDGGMKMTGASHGTGTDQIIYSTVAESMSGGEESGSSTGNTGTGNTDYGAGSSTGNN